MPIKFDLTKYKNPVFVETGTFRGDSVSSALHSGFDKVYSIEIDDELYENAVNRFRSEIDDGRVILLHGDSGLRLPEIIETVEYRCTFWLDAHSQKFNFDNGTTGKENCPLYRELNTIGASARNDHTILIDDMRLVKNPNAWRGHDVTFEGVLDRLKTINGAYSFDYENGHVEDDVLTAVVPPA